MSKSQEPKRRKPRHLESKLQQSCVAWFRLQYPRFASVLFAIPNGGARNGFEAAIMKMEGVTPGVCDLFLSVPMGNYAGFYIELKIKPNTPSEDQVKFIESVRSLGYKASVIYDIDTFIEAIRSYMENIGFARIEEVVCRHYGIRTERVRSKTQKREVSEPRFLIMALHSFDSNKDPLAVTSMYGLGRSNLYHARKTVANLYRTNVAFRSRANEILNELKLTEKAIL